MEQDWLISALKFIRLNLGIILVSLGLFAVLIWGGINFIQNFPTQSEPQPTVVVEENEQISATATVVPTPLAQIMDAPVGPTSPNQPTPPAVATAAAKPTPATTVKPTPSPTPKPILTQLPTTAASAKPTATPTPKPTLVATVKPSPTPTPVLTASPTIAPTRIPTATPTAVPTPTPVITPAPTATPAAEAPVAMTKGGLPLNAQGNVIAQPTEPTAGTITAGGSYTVQRGDSSWKLAEKFLGNGYRYVEIEKANKLRHNQHLEVGQVLTIPEKGTASATSQVTKGDQVTTPQPAQTSGKTYTIQAGDTLWSIAAKELGTPYQWSTLYKANAKTIGRNPGLIYPGQTLQLPAMTTPSNTAK